MRLKRRVACPIKEGPKLADDHGEQLCTSSFAVTCKPFLQLKVTALISSSHAMATKALVHCKLQLEHASVCGPAEGCFKAIEQRPARPAVRRMRHGRPIHVGRQYNLLADGAPQ